MYSANSITIFIRDIVEQGLIVIKNDEIFERQIRAFVEDDFIGAKTDDGRLAAIYPGYRLPEDPDHPFTLLEIKSTGEQIASEFNVLNSANMTISSNQSLGGKFSLPGALIAIRESKKVILLPRVEILQKKIKKYQNKMPKPKRINFIQVEKIPIIEDMPAPQARVHKLLLAYYLILAHDYNSARELLHPSSSLNHNEFFSIDELEILSWIVSINSDMPEAMALKLVAFIHLAINRSKFPLYYYQRISHKNQHDFENINALVDEIEKIVPKKVIVNYMWTI